MDHVDKEKVTAQSNIIRGELKIWEKQFAAENQGRKASREDIKHNPEIGKCPTVVSNS